MSRHPRRARCQAIELPTMPAPMTTTFAFAGSPAMCLLQRPLIRRRRFVVRFGPRSRTLECARSGPCRRLAAPPAERAGLASGEIHHDRFELGQPLDREPPADPPEPALGSRTATEREVRLPVVGAF